MERLEILEAAERVADDRAVVTVEDAGEALAIREEAERMSRIRVVPPAEEGEAWRVGPLYRL